MTEEFRILPQNHRVKEDKLEVKKMTLHAMCPAVKSCEGISSDGSDTNQEEKTRKRKGKKN